LHLVGCLYYLYQRCTVKQISDNEIYLLIKYIKCVLWRVAKRLSYTEDARCLKVNTALQAICCRVCNIRSALAVLPEDSHSCTFKLCVIHVPGRFKQNSQIIHIYSSLAHTTGSHAHSRHIVLIKIMPQRSKE